MNLKKKRELKIMQPNSKYYQEYYEFILNEKEPDSKSKKAVFKIINDIEDRRGIGDEFENIDSVILDEIIDVWIEHINSSIA